MALACCARVLAGCGGGANVSQNPTWAAARARPLIRARRRAPLTSRSSWRPCGATCAPARRPIAGSATTPAARRRCSPVTTTSTWPTRRPTPSSICRTRRSSQMVAKVAGGHHCWLGSDPASVQACATIVATWIENWANPGGTAGARQISLKAPVLKDVGSSRSFPADPACLQTTAARSAAHGVLRGLPQFHGHGAAVSRSSPIRPCKTAYDAAKPKIDLDDPDNSRLVVRLRDEFHNCWSDLRCQRGGNGGGHRGLPGPGSRQRRGSQPGRSARRCPVRRHGGQRRQPLRGRARSRSGSSRKDRAARRSTPAA